MVVCDIKLKMLNVLPLSDQLRSKKNFMEKQSVSTVRAVI